MKYLSKTAILLCIICLSVYVNIYGRNKLNTTVATRNEFSTVSDQPKTTIIDKVSASVKATVTSIPDLVPNVKVTWGTEEEWEAYKEKREEKKKEKDEIIKKENIEKEKENLILYHKDIRENNLKDGIRHISKCIKANPYEYTYIKIISSE